MLYQEFLKKIMNVEHENISTLIHRKARIADLYQIIELLLEGELGGMRESKSAELDKNYIKAFHKIDSDPSQYLMVVENSDEVIGTCYLTIMPSSLSSAVPVCK